MINIFDLSAGMAGTKMLPERDHRNGSPVHRNNPNVNEAATPSATNTDNKQITSVLHQNSSKKKSGGTPMKMLIAQEMSKETKSKRKPHSVVARLMGLDDDLTTQLSPVASQRKLLEGYPQTASAGVHRGHLQDDVFCNKEVPCELHQHDCLKMERRYVSEVWKQPSQSRSRRCGETQNDLRMALVRQKFMEAKHLATDENLIHSKEFQDALEVLNLNRDLFLKFLEEPNSLFSKQTFDLRSVPPPPQPNHITVLKPSKKVETKFEKLVKKQEGPEIKETGRETNNHHWNSTFDHLKAESFSQPTRIVVLKPSTGNPTKAPTTTMSPKHLVQGDLGDSEAFGPKYIEERTQQMHKILSGHRRDESLLSSVYSNSFGGDGSSFNLFETDYIEEDGGGFSDSDVAAPMSRHSWDRFNSPCSVSSFSRVSHSPESSVIREAKKRLSERWALVTSNGTSQEQLHLPKSSSTLGEMLAISDVKREECVNRYTVSASRSCGGEDELTLPAFFLSVDGKKNSGELSPENLSRSKSVPVSCSAYKDIGLKYEGSNTQLCEPTVSEVSKTKHGKSSFRGRFSSFFFSRSKETRKRPVSSSMVGSGGADVVASRTDEMLKSVHGSSSANSQVKDEEQSASTASISVTNVSKKPMQSVENSRTSDKSSEEEKLSPRQNYTNNLDQPSPTSILDAQFEDDVNGNLLETSEANARQQLISRASPIESVARTLSWDDTHLEMRLPEPSSFKVALSKADGADQDHFVFVQKLLSYAGLEKSDMMFTGWHSPDSPLDPVLLDKLLGLKEDESNCMEKSPTLRLLFDCVNLALLEVSWSTLMSVYPWNRASCGAQVNACASSALSEDVWSLVRDWSSGNGTVVFTENDIGSLVVDRVLRTEAGGNRWVELNRIVEEIAKEITGDVLKDLVGEAFSDLAAACIY
ncbi:unnamed protein product [Musa acuminata subsp. burmannicoides]